jgi:superfamily I DNA/RNA helicase
VIQIIAPAGSGKTAVLVERVRELRRRGVPPQAICCVTFNKHAKNELQSRLRKWGVGDVRARTFHGLGAMILDREGKLREHVDEPTPSQWRLLANNAKRSAGQYGVWLDPHEAQAHISELKLGRLLSPAEYADTICETSDAVERTVSALYEGYEEQQRRCRPDGLRRLDLLLAAPVARRAIRTRALAAAL